MIPNPQSTIPKRVKVSTAAALTCAATIAAFIAGVSSGMAQSSEPGSPKERVELRYDQENAELNVVIDGVSVARFAGSGLEVIGDVSFSGYLIDTGRSDAPAQ